MPFTSTIMCDQKQVNQYFAHHLLNVNIGYIVPSHIKTVNKYNIGHLLSELNLW